MKTWQLIGLGVGIYLLMQTKNAQAATATAMPQIDNTPLTTSEFLKLKASAAGNAVLAAPNGIAMTATQILASLSNTPSGQVATVNSQPIPTDAVTKAFAVLRTIRGKAL